MEIAKKVQASKQVIASGFCALRDKNGNLFCQTVVMNSDKQFTANQDLQFHPCAKIQADIAKNNGELLVPYQKGVALNLGQVQIDGAEQNLTNTASVASVEHRQSYNR